MKTKHTHSPFLAKAVGATKPDASETRHRATSTTNALKAMVISWRSWRSLENAVDIGKAKLTVGREESRKQEGANNEARLLSFCMSAIFHNKSRTRYFAIFEKRHVFETVKMHVSYFRRRCRARTRTHPGKKIRSHHQSFITDQTRIRYRSQRACR